tara:strand:- start:7214 stop:7957 length:744 start_codon:yes stop_codon:yes gene_type:complete
MKIKNILLVILIITSINILNSCSDNTTESSLEEIQKKVNSILPDSVNLVSIEKTDMDQFYELKFNDMESLYVTNNGNYLISGDIFEISRGELINKSSQRKEKERQKVLASLDENEFISFLAKKPRFKIYVFTDVDCTYCRKFHDQINIYNSLGIEVNYLAFPRTGLGSESYKKMLTAWCSPNPQEVLTSLKLGVLVEENLCNNSAVEKHFNLGNSLGVKGTPSIMTSEGKLIPGYLSPEELIKQLGI